MEENPGWFSNLVTFLVIRMSGVWNLLTDLTISKMSLKILAIFRLSNFLKQFLSNLTAAIALETTPFPCQK